MKKTLIAGLIMTATSFGAIAGECEETYLATQMQDLKSEVQIVGKSIKTGDREKAMEHVELAMDALRKSRDETPYKYKDGFSESQKASYQQKIDDSLGALENVGMYVYGSDFDKATDELKALSSIRKSSHGEFKEDC